MIERPGRSILYIQSLLLYHICYIVLQDTMLFVKRLRVYGEWPVGISHPMALATSETLFPILYLIFSSPHSLPTTSSVASSLILLSQTRRQHIACAFRLRQGVFVFAYQVC